MALKFKEIPESTARPDERGRITLGNSLTSGVSRYDVFVDDETGLAECGDAGVILRTWTATDACGLTATCVQTITITNSEPVLNCDNLDIEIACTAPRGENDLPKPTVTDDCTPVDQLTITFNDDTSGLDACGEQGTIVRTYTVTDACGLTTICDQIITITNEAPVLDCANLDMTIECGDDITPATLGMPTATDDCTPVSEINSWGGSPMKAVDAWGKSKNNIPNIAQLAQFSRRKSPSMGGAPFLVLQWEGSQKR